MSFLTQTPTELVNIFSRLSFEVLTKKMNKLEGVIAEQQSYIDRFGKDNDTNSDSAWQSYKTEAEDNLIVWDCMKQARDAMKGKNVGQCDDSAE